MTNITDNELAAALIDAFKEDEALRTQLSAALQQRNKHWLSILLAKAAEGVLGDIACGAWNGLKKLVSFLLDNN